MDDIKKKTIISALSLFFQSGYAAALGLVANLVLTILLTPKVFGIYFTILSLISILNYFSDIGLAASLVQKKEVSEDDIKTTFTVQQLLIVSIITLGFFATSFVSNFYQLPKEGVHLYWAFLISFFLSSLKTIPSIFLERKVQFQKIVFVQIVENTLFYLTVIILAIMGGGVKSFTAAVLLRSLAGLLLIYNISFWRPRFGIAKNSLKQLVSFGLPFQASSFLALFKDDLINLYLGKVLGFEALGYIGWAKKWAEAPIRIIMDNLSRVLFPVFARLQHDTKRISQLVEKNLYYQTLLLAPTMIGLVVLMKPLTTIIPKYSKWSPALPVFYLFSLSAFFSSYSTPFINLFNGLGKVKISFSFMIFWTLTTWFLTPLLTKFFGLFGFPLTQVALSFTFILVVFQAKKLISFSFLKPIYPSIATSLIMGGIVFLFKRLVFIDIVLGVFVYLIILNLLFKINIIKEIKSLFFHG